MSSLLSRTARRLAGDWFLLGMLLSVVSASLLPDAGRSGGWLHMEKAVDFGVAIVFFLLGIALFGIGMLGEYIGRIYEEVKRRPTYLIAHDEDRSPLRDKP